MNFQSILIANRGEIAVRVIRAAKALGLQTVQVYSDADKESLAVRLADESVNIGPPAAAKSYLNIGAIIDAAKAAKVDAIHPGYGFLSENADFVDAVEAANMVFIGPSGNSIRLLGNKIAARQIAEEAGVPTVPGSDGKVADLDAGRLVVAQIGYPVMIKAAAGGGGRGIRIASNIEEFERFFPQASAEAFSAFGDGSLYIEKLIETARHVEVQILGDGENFVHCFERECSMQRRRQKVWEEAPALCLSPEIRTALCDRAVALARQVKYEGAGTVEFLYDQKAEEFYFIEVNTRIQVEHTITEAITGIDLVQEMIRIAGGEGLSVKQEDLRVSGHAIECRINAEDPAKDFMPWPGLVDTLEIPKGDGIRFDTLLYPGYSIPPFYDSLLGKLIVWGEDRADCLSRLRHALKVLKISGVPTTIPLHIALANDEDVSNGTFDTKFLETWLETKFTTANNQIEEIA